MGFSVVTHCYPPTWSCGRLEMRLPEQHHELCLQNKLVREPRCRRYHHSDKSYLLYPQHVLRHWWIWRCRVLCQWFLIWYLLLEGRSRYLSRYFQKQSQQSLLSRCDALHPQKGDWNQSWNQWCECPARSIKWISSVGHKQSIIFWITTVNLPIPSPRSVAHLSGHYWISVLSQWTVDSLRIFRMLRHWKLGRSCNHRSHSQQLG